MSWKFDYKRAWETWAKPEFLKLPDDVKQLVAATSLQCEGQRQNKSFGMDWPEGLEAKFKVIDPEVLRKAREVVYGYGHWDSRGHKTPADKAWQAPDYLNDDSGGYWKFDAFARQMLAVIRSDTRPHLKFENMVENQYDYYTHEEGTDLCSEELAYKYDKLVKPMFGKTRIHMVNVAVKGGYGHVEAHPFCIGTQHFPKDGGMYIDVHQAGCAYKGCGRPYEDHTHDNALGVTLLANTKKKEASEFLKTLTPEMEKDKLVGFAFHSAGFKFIDEE